MEVVMVDFSKLRDPEWQAQARREREEAEALREAHDKKLKAAVELCLIASESLAENERSLVRNCRMRLNTYQAVSDKQEKWLLDIAAKLRSSVVARFAGGVETGEHPAYTRANWPHAEEYGADPSAYWAWVRHQVEVYGE
jgi:hypothetical protein